MHMPNTYSALCTLFEDGHYELHTVPVRRLSINCRLELNIYC